MVKGRAFAFAARIAAASLLIGAGCASESEPATTSPPTTATTTTTTVVGGGAAEPTETAPKWPDPELPQTFMVLFEESFVCQLGAAGESDIRAAGEVSVALEGNESGYEVTGEGDLSVTGLVRAGDVCSGDAAGTHVAKLSGQIEVPETGTATLNLVVGGTWYESWDGEIQCSGGLPPTGPWNWPAEPNAEILTFAPFEDGATWEQDVTMGLCQGTVTRTIEF